MVELKKDEGVKVMFWPQLVSFAQVSDCDNTFFVLFSCTFKLLL